MDPKQEKIACTFKEAIQSMREKNYYLKDFHFFKEINEPYKLPKILQEDFLNEYSDHVGLDDYRFLYLGLDGSWTRMHHDVLKSFSWSVNLTGFKKWIFVSPEQESFLKDKFGNVLENINNYDLSGFRDAEKVVVQEIMQGPGQIIFVPS